MKNFHVALVFLTFAVLGTSVVARAAEETVTTEVRRCFKLKGDAPANAPIPVPTRICLERVHVILDPRGPWSNRAMAIGSVTVDGRIMALPIESVRAYASTEYEGTEIVSYSAAISYDRRCAAALDCEIPSHSFMIMMEYAPADARGRPLQDSWKISGTMTKYNPDGWYKKFSYELEQL